MNLEELTNYARNNKIEISINEEYSDLVKNSVINVIEENNNIVVTISKGLNKDQMYRDYKVNELGNVPIMMYHGIVNMSDNDTSFTGGNVDKDGYHRTTESFIRDLEFYYNNNYRMIRLSDYVNGIVDVELGKTPIILTFDDGLANNIKVTGLDENGNVIIDPFSAVGILESFKQKYPDFNVTATFFVNGTLFHQPEYNDKILNYLINHGYDIGNHTYNHVDFTKISSLESEEEIGKIYNLLDQYIPQKYVNIVALPFGSPYSMEHDNFNHILTSNYNKTYYTTSTLRVGWESNLSPFNSNFNKVFLKRIRAYDNNGTEYDIKMNFNLLENNRYISDGNKDEVVVPIGNEVNTNLKLITY